jgi:hypothetical protein
MEVVVLHVEGHAQLDQPVDGMGRALDHEFDRLLPVEPGPATIVSRMVFKRVARIQHGGDPALRPGGRSAGQRALGQHQHLEPSASASAAVKPAAPEPTTITSAIIACLSLTLAGLPCRQWRPASIPFDVLRPLRAPLESRACARNKSKNHGRPPFFIFFYKPSSTYVHPAFSA